MNLLFIMYNIFDIHNGVSNKYINFIKSIENNHNISIIMTKYEENKPQVNIFNNTKIYYTKGLKIPFYNKIKIPNINETLLNNIINKEKYSIIFNGEFFWIYDILIKFKKKYNNILLFPSWHTDYEEYFKRYITTHLNIDIMMNVLYNNLKTNIFNGIIATGEYTCKKFLDYTKNIFNANELCIDNFNNSKIDLYKKGDILNFIYCGRISIEKNIDEIFKLLNTIDNNIKFNIHIIGDGPYLEELKMKYKNNKNEIFYYYEIKYDRIIDIYKKINNRIFIMCSETETFGKAPMEAGLTGVPIFVKKFNNIEYMYNDKNAFVFENNFDFINNLIFFLNITQSEREKIIYNSINNIKKYDQKKIFKEWELFLLNVNNIDNINNIDKIDNINNKTNNENTFIHFMKLIKCSMNIISE